MYKKEEDKNKLGKIEWTVIIISGFLIIFSFLAPILFTKSTINGIDFSDTGSIGDTIGGIMNPFIALAGVFLTFLAFYIQYKANKQQRNLFRQELDSNKFENQFYEMLRLHKENVNEISLSLTSDEKNYSTISSIHLEVKGRETFKLLIEEIKIIYFVVKKNFLTDTPDLNIEKTYNIFYHGISSYKNTPKTTKEGNKLHNVIESLEYINNGNRNYGNRGNKYNFQSYVSEKSDYYSAELLNYNLFHGHSEQLAHYFRHLYQTVKFITKQSDDFLNYKEKRNYLRILRSQLSNQEQAMLFYNWKSKFGKSWEGRNNADNKFFTDYRMIHNLYDDLLISDFKLIDSFDIHSEKLRKEKGRTEDHLFEFQDWKI